MPQARARVGNMFLTPATLSQHAGLIAMDEEEELEANIDVYRANRALMLDALPAMGLRSIAPPDGAFYIYADVAHLTDDSLSFCQRLLQDTGVATAPGVDFDPVEGRHFIRMSFAVSTPLTSVRSRPRTTTDWPSSLGTSCCGANEVLALMRLRRPASSSCRVFRPPCCSGST